MCLVSTIFQKASGNTKSLFAHYLLDLIYMPINNSLDVSFTLWMMTPQMSLKIKSGFQNFSAKFARNLQIKMFGLNVTYNVHPIGTIHSAS